MRKKLPALFVAALLATPIVALPYSAAARPQDQKKQRGEAKYREKLLLSYIRMHYQGR